MKNLFRKSLLFVWVLMAVLFSCEEKVEVTNQDLSVSEAHAWFNQYAKDSTSLDLGIQTAGRVDSIKNSNQFKKEIFWNKARKISLNGFLKVFECLFGMSPAYALADKQLGNFGFIRTLMGR